MKNVKTTLLISAIAAGLLMTAANAAPRGGERMEMPSFAELDTNSDGVLSAEELKAPMVARFNEADTNGDGGLSADEMAAAKDKNRADRIAKMIERKDQNGDGLLQIEEMGRKGDKGDMFAKIDANSDGSISEEEFNAAKEKMGKRGKRGHGKGHGKGDCDGKGRNGDKRQDTDN